MGRWNLNGCISCMMKPYYFPAFCQPVTLSLTWSEAMHRGWLKVRALEVCMMHTGRINKNIRFFAHLVLFCFFCRGENIVVSCFFVLLSILSIIASTSTKNPIPAWPRHHPPRRCKHYWDAIARPVRSVDTSSWVMPLGARSQPARHNVRAFETAPN